MIRLRIDDHLIIPFGRPKWDISKIRLVGVSTQATYFESDTPCAYLDKTRNNPLRLMDFRDLFPEPERFPEQLDDSTALEFVAGYLKTDCQLQTPSENLFLDLYFGFLTKSVVRHSWLRDQPAEKVPPPMTGTYWMFAGLMPLPQAHLYLEDPLRPTERHNIAPNTMVKVDFAFWTGKRVIAVEIDGGSHIGSENHVRKDRLLHRAGVEIIHILNDELTTHGIKAIEKLLPEEITHYWKDEKYAYNPFDDIPF